MSEFHFIAGLPRSGSTLLSALLLQNPRFWAGVSGPVYGLVRGMQRGMCEEEFISFYTERRRADLIRGVFNAYYAAELETRDDAVIFDTNRAWTSMIPLLARLYPQCRIICCVRSISWIIDSIERMLDRNPLHTSRIFQGTQPRSVYDRAQTLMNQQRGLVGLPLQTLKEAWFGPFSDRLVVIDYDRFVAHPSDLLGLLYEELGLPPFRHNFNNIIFDQVAYDDVLGMPGLHAVRPAVTKPKRPISLPADLLSQFQSIDFWRGDNPNEVLVL